MGGVGFKEATNSAEPARRIAKPSAAKEEPTRDLHGRILPRSGDFGGWPSSIAVRWNRGRPPRTSACTHYRFKVASSFLGPRRPPLAQPTTSHIGRPCAYDAVPLRSAYFTASP